MKINNLSFKFGNNSPYFFKDLTIDFEPNQIHFIQGDNGVGKSTFFNILQGKISPESQLSATVALQDISYTTHNNAFDASLTDQIRMVQQNYDLMIASQYSFFENLQLANLPRYPGLASLPNPTIFEGVKNIILPASSTPAYLLSGGQRQLLAILMVLQKPTRVLLLDEPTATLDQKNAHMVMECLKQLAPELKITIVVICHDKELVESYCSNNYFVMIKEENDVRQIKVQKL